MSQYEVQFEPSSDIADATNKAKNEAKEIIENNLPPCIDKSWKPKTLATKEHVRLDLQGQFNRNGVRYANLQIQLNRPRMVAAKGEAAEVEEEEEMDASGKPKSTTIAIVLMPSGENIPVAISQQAFNGSLDTKQKAVIVKKY